MNRRKWALLAILLVAFALRIWRLDAQSLWWDEMVTVFRTVSPPSLMWDDILRARNQVPLYYLLMRPWMALGQSAFWARYASVWWGVLTVALVFRLGARLASPYLGAGAAALLTLLPLHIWYSQEARMYTLLGVLVIFSYLRLLHLVRDPLDWWGWLGYGVALLAALYTHYFGFLLLLTQSLPLLGRWRYRKALLIRWLIVTTVVNLLFLPWLTIVLKAGRLQQPGWIAMAHWYELLLTVYAFGLGGTAAPTRWWNWLAFGVLLVSVFKGTRQLLRQASSPLVGQMIIHWLLVPLSLMWFLSIGIPGVPQMSLYMDRYVTWLLPVFALLVAWGWQRWQHHHWSAWVAAALYGICVLISLNALYSNPSYAREDWRSAVARMNRLAADDAVLVSRPVQRLPLWYYPPSDSITTIESPGGVLEGSVTEWLGLESPPDQLWLITLRENTNAHGFPFERNRALDEGARFDGLKKELDARYSVEHRLRFPGIILSCYRLEEKDGV